MNIIWTPNPLYTRIILEPHEQEVLRLKIQVSELEELIGDVEYELSKDNRDIAKAMLRLDSERWDGEDGTIAQRVNVLFRHYKSELENARHAGDCTCLPASCSKCFGEEFLGINTIKGADKYMLNHINIAFGPENDRTIDEALQWLRNYEPRGKFEGWEAHVPRWTAESKRALDWLTQYREEHFSS